MREHSSGSYIEGFGDELVYGILTSLACLLPFAVIMFVWSRNNQNSGVIHPDSQETVDRSRQRLREQNQATSLGSSATATGSLPGATPSTASPDACPICLAQPRYAIETNCGHIFCGECLVTYWRMGRWISAIRCPLCRQTVSIMLFSFTEEERQTPSEGREEVISSVHTYNRRFSGEPREWLEYIRDLPTLLRHCLTEFFSLSGLILMFRFRVVLCFLAALLYFISPLDIIPEAMFGLLGLLDDFFVFLLLAIYISIIYRQMIAARANDA